MGHQYVMDNIQFTLSYSTKKSTKIALYEYEFEPTITDRCKDFLKEIVYLYAKKGESSDKFFNKQILHRDFPRYLCAANGPRRWALGNNAAKVCRLLGLGRTPEDVYQSLGIDEDQISELVQERALLQTAFDEALEEYGHIQSKVTRLKAALKELNYLSIDLEDDDYGIEGTASYLEHLIEDGTARIKEIRDNAEPIFIKLNARF